MKNEKQVCTDSKDNPVVRVELPKGAMRDRLVAALKKAGVTVASPDSGTPLTEQALNDDSDLVIVRKSQVSRELLDKIYAGEDSEETPGWVVIGDDLNAGQRAELASSGVSRVLDASDSAERMARTVQTLAEAEASGGLSGPECRGDPSQPKLADFLSRNATMRKFLDLVRKVSDADASIMITGETGVGKERLARAIHAQSARCDEAFVAVNCGAFPENLIESELFGHEKGAFTGADSKRIGVFEQAHKGTIFLDEIGELPAHLQVKLLTVLQRLEVRRIGGTKDISVDVRVMAATNRQVKEEVDAGNFREDLYFRLNVIALDIPPLRERAEDIADLAVGLVVHLCEADSREEVPTFTRQALDAMIQYPWPGNIRELINAVERALLLCDTAEIELEHLPQSIYAGEYSVEEIPMGSTASPGSDSSDFHLPQEWYSLSIQDLRNKVTEWAERDYLDHILKENRGHIAQTAQRAGIGTRALYDRMKRLDLNKEDYKPDVG